MTDRVKIFVSYSHKDKKLFEEFKTMLAPARLDLWDDQKISPSADWKKEIEGALASADVAVLLVSQSFLASHFIQQNELPPLLDAARTKGLTVFWVCLSPCLVGLTEIAKFQGAHDIGHPLDQLSRSERQATLRKICEELLLVVDRKRAPTDHLSLAEEFFGKQEHNSPLLPNVRFWPIHPHRNVSVRPGALSLRFEDWTVKLGAHLTEQEREINGFITKLIEAFHTLSREEYWNLFKLDPPFLELDILPKSDAAVQRKLEIIEQLRSDPTLDLNGSRLHNIENFLLTRTKEPRKATAVHEWNEKHPDGYRHTPFQFNGPNVMLVSLRERDWVDPFGLTYELRFCKSDYFTYRCIADCSGWIRTKLVHMIGSGKEELKRYLADPPIVHGGFGVLVVVRTRDEKLIIRKRSNKCADFMDANKWAVSANEGLRADLDVNTDGSFKPCTQIIARALQNELVGHSERGKELVRAMDCALTGVLLYLPNLCVNLCFLVRLNAKFDEIKDLERSTIHLDEFIPEETRGEPFTRRGICSFVASTRQPNQEGLSVYAKSWCEGSLVPYFLALQNEGL